MNERIETFRNKAKELWEETDKKKKIYFGIGIVLFLLIVTLLIVKVTTPKYELLFADLSFKDMGAISKQLDDMNIPWKTGENESSILVPAEYKTKAKIELASQGLPKEGYSFSDAFSESGWTMTDYDKRQRMKQALQTDLANTISEIDGISSAKVYIEEKERTSFVLDNEEDKTTASVFIVKDPQAQLTNDQVMAIKNLVAGAITMKAEDVVITDNDGRLLDGHQEEDFVGDKFTMKKKLESRINDSIRNFLANIYGYNNVDVLASVKLNMDSEKRTEQIFSPPIEGSEEGIIRSSEEIEESMIGAAIAGAPGVETNIEDYTMLEEEMSDRYSKASKIINNEINEINREIRKAPGEVETITVAVLINENSLPGGELTVENEEEITNLIYAATGLDTKNVKVSAGEFNRDTEADLEDKEGLNMNQILPIVLIIIILGAIAFLYIRRRQKEADKELEEALLEESIKEQMESDRVNELEFEVEESHMKKQIDKFVDEKPDAVTQLLRTWLNE